MSDQIVFHDQLEQAPGMSFGAYKVQTSELSIEQIRKHINQIAYDGHGPDYSIGGPRKIVVQSITDFERLMQDLTAQNKIEWQTAQTQLSEANCKDKISAHLRHDVDLDIFTALEIAKIEARFNAPSTFYILHTAPYYGRFENGEFHRNESMLAIYREIQDLGHEIALHTDAYFLYLNHGIDGSQAIRAEIDWLRSNGIKIAGTVAHNSYPVYGVENFAIFEGRRLRMNMDGGPAAYTYKDKTMPLGVLNENEMGLEYEGNDIFYMNKGFVEYACLMNQDQWFCQTNRRLELDESVESDCIVFSEWLDLGSLTKHVNGLSRDYFLVLSIHPIFYGLRHDATQSNTREYSQSQLGWEKPGSWPVFEPATLHAEYDKTDASNPGFQSLSFVDTHGFLNRPPVSGVVGNAALKILMLGGSNIAAGSVSVASQVQSRLEISLETSLSKSIEVYKAAHPKTGLSRLIGWYLDHEKELKPHYVVLAIKSDEFVQSLAYLWKYMDGWHPDFPPGPFLQFGDDGVVKIESTPTAASMRTNVENPKGDISLCLANSNLPVDEFSNNFTALKAIIENFATRIRENGAIPVLLVEKCGEELGIWEHDAPKSKRIQSYQNFAMYLRALCKNTSVEVCNPYPVLIDEFDKYTTHHHKNLQWNEHGHYIVANELAEFIERLEERDHDGYV